MKQPTVFFFLKFLCLALLPRQACCQGESLMPFLQNHLWGYADRQGLPAIEARYHDASFFQDGLGRVRHFGLYGFVNETGGEEVLPQFISATDFSEGYSLVLDTFNRLYFIDKQGKQAFSLPEGVVQAEPFKDGLAKVSLQVVKKRKGVDEPTLLTGFINTRGEMAIPAVYDDAADFENGLAAVVKSGKMGVINREGRVVITIGYDYIGAFVDGLAAFRWKGKYGYLDKTGRKVIKPRFDNVGDFGNGLAPVMINRLWGYVNTAGQLVIKPKYVYAENFSEGMAGVVINKKWGFINRAGELKIRSIYDDYAPFSEGLAAVQYKGQWGYTDSTGTFAVLPAFNIAGSFRGGITLVETATEAIYIKPDGSRIVAYSIDEQKRQERLRETVWNKAEMRYLQEYADWKKKKKH